MKKYFCPLYVFFLFQTNYMSCKDNQDLSTYNIIFNWIIKNKLQVVLGASFVLSGAVGLILYFWKNRKNACEKTSGIGIELVRYDINSLNHIEFKNPNHKGRCGAKCDEECTYRNNKNGCCASHCEDKINCEKKHLFCKGDGMYKSNFSFLGGFIRSSSYLKKVFEACCMLLVKNKTLSNLECLECNDLLCQHCSSGCDCDGRKESLSEQKLEEYRKIICEFYIFRYHIIDYKMVHFKLKLEYCDENLQLNKAGVKFLESESLPVSFFEGI